MVNNNLIKKIILSTVIFIFLCVSSVPSTSTTLKQKYIPTLSENTLYVGGNGTGNYTSIQDAINDANPGDTVFVYDDSSPYYENINISKKLNLMGENRNTTVIDGNGSGNVVYINKPAELVTINGFIIQSGRNGISINHSKECTITNNIFENNINGGIRLRIHTKSKITGNTFINNLKGVILLFV
jgi:parallel beta-helix repeat protein